MNATPTLNNRIESLIALINSAIGDTPPVVSRIGAKATLLAKTDPQVGETFELLIDCSLRVAYQRRVANDPDVQAARRWMREAAQAARAPR